MMIDGLHDSLIRDPYLVKGPPGRVEFSAPPDPAEQFRLTMRRFASSVTIVTVRAGEEIHGMTATAVCSVSLAPPLLLVCLATDSLTERLVTRGGIFAVNLLSEGQRELADRFAGRRAVGTDRFLGVGYRCAATGAPILDQSLAYCDCRVVAVHGGGDHTIFIGQVEAAGWPGGGPPLVYHQGEYVRLPMSE